MKAKLLFSVVILSLVFGSYPVSVGQAMQTSAQPEPTAEPQTAEADPAPNMVTEGDLIPDEIADVPGVTEDWWAAVQEQIRQDMYDLSSGMSHQGYNLAHNFDLTFTSDGVRLTPRQPALDPARDESRDPLPAADQQPAAADEEEQWEWGLVFTGYGYASTLPSTGQGNVQPVSAPAEMIADGNRVEYRRDGITEWYINDDRGLEQGFTIDTPPASPDGRASGEGLILEMSLDTDLIPLLSTDAQAIEFTLPGDNVVLLRYAELYVTDATGRELPAHFSLSDGGKVIGESIRIVIDDSGATYPLIVDPLVTSTPWTATGENPGDSFGDAAGTAGDVNGDGFADVVVSAIGYGSVGRLYVYHGSASGLRLGTSIDGTGDLFGRAVGTAGDVNGDGYDDIIVGDFYHDSRKGKTYVYYGSASGLGGVSWEAVGEHAYDRFGWSVGTAGDVNGDGYDDVIVGADEWYPGGSYTGVQGKVYVYYGSSTGLTTGAADWTATGEDDDDYFGDAVGTAGDVNGDGYDDIIVGAWAHDTLPETGVGRVYLYHGSLWGLPVTYTSYIDGENGGNSFGHAVGTAGDVNGDGYDDIIVGAYTYDAGTEQSVGKAYVYHGTAMVVNVNPNWTAIGAVGDDQFGAAVGTAGDVNGDGYDDIIVGASPGGTPDKVYVYAGSSDGLGGTPTWTAAGENPIDHFGASIGTAGDVNGDGFADVLIVAPNTDAGTGKAYVYYGATTGLSRSPAWHASGQSASEYFGWSVGTAGDVDGDGFADLVVGAYGYNDSAGKVYLYRGSPTGPGGAPAWSAVAETAGDRFGYRVGTAGDVNGDGYDDVLIGAPGHNRAAGGVYVYHGSAAGLGGTPAWSGAGEGSGDGLGSAAGTAGDVNGDGYADVVIGAYGFPNGNGQGKVYVYHGSSTGLPAGPADWTDVGEYGGDTFGHVVGTAGDVNGDGFDDVVIGSPGYDSDTGKAHIYYGTETGLDDSSGLVGENVGDRFAAAVGTAGDVNGDGYADVIVGAPGHDGDTGKAYVYHGSVTGIAGTPAWDDASSSVYDRYGAAVGTAGDVNGDGYADVIIGKPGDSDSTGMVSIIEGSATGLTLAGVSYRSGENAGEHFGSAVGTAGDVNGDGFADVIVGAYGYDTPSAGNVGKGYLYLGMAATPGDTAPFTPITLGWQRLPAIPPPLHPLEKGL